MKISETSRGPRNCCIACSLLQTSFCPRMRRFRVGMLACVVLSGGLVFIVLLLDWSPFDGRLANFDRSAAENLLDLDRRYRTSDLCLELIRGNQSVRQFAANHESKVDENEMQKMYLSTNCGDLSRDYVTSVDLLDAEERSVPIAFGIHVYKNVWQFERLLRAVYRPHNWYCVHVDRKSHRQLLRAVRRIASCFGNVAVTNRVDVRWGTIRQVDAELECMHELLRDEKAWRYFINLTGEEFPLKTMWQLSRILRALNGSNSMEATVARNQEDRRLQLEPYTKRFNITPVKGAVHIVVVRGFVKYALENPIAVGMYKHLLNAPHPDESFFATLNHNGRLQVPGGYLGVPETDAEVYPFINRLKIWQWEPGTCHGIYQRSVCVWGVGDLPFITSQERRQLIINKLKSDFQHYALDCLEEWYWNATLTELRARQSVFDATYYANLRMSKLHVAET